MKGSTTIVFNAATMIEAVQMYLDDQLTLKHEVAAVKYKSQMNCDTFEVELKVPDEKPKLAAVG